LLSVLGEVELSRPYYLCKQCGEGQFPVDQQLDVEKTKNTPGVRRMLALVGHQTAFQRGKEQMKILAGLELTTKAVERTAEAIGEDIVQREQEEIARALQLDLPEMMGPPIPVLYVEMDGTGVPMVSKETADRPGKTAGQSAYPREAERRGVFTDTTWHAQRY